MAQLDDIKLRAARWRAHRNPGRGTTNASQAAEDREWLLSKAHELAVQLAFMLRVAPVNTNTRNAEKALKAFMDSRNGED